MPSSTTSPRPISPAVRSPMQTRADVTRWTTARTSVTDLNQRRRLVLEPCRHAVAQLATRVETQVEQVAGLHVAERLEHRLLDPGMFDLEIHDQAFDPLALQAQVATRRAAAADDRQAHFLGVQPRLV